MKIENYYNFLIECDYNRKLLFLYKNGLTVRLKNSKFKFEVNKLM